MYTTSTPVPSSSSYEPRQNIPEREKTYDWTKRNIDHIVSLCAIRSDSPEKQAYDRYNGKRNDAMFEHITRTYGIDFPEGKLKHIPLIRPMVNKLYTEQASRPFDYTTRSEDTESIYDKLQQISDSLLLQITQVIMSGDDVEDKLNSLQQEYESFQSDLEISAHYALQSYSARHKLHDSFNECFLDKAITGKEIMQVCVDKIGEDPVMKIWKPGTVWFARNNVTWISECDWAMAAERLTAVEILDRFGDVLSASDAQRIEDWVNYDPSAYKLRNEADVDKLITSPEELDSILSDDAVYKHTVYYVEWKSIRKINIFQNENKYDSTNDAPWSKLLSDEQVLKLPGGRKNKVKYRYVQDLWKGIRIDNDIYGMWQKGVGKVAHPVRSFTNLSKVHLSFEGLTYNGPVKAWSTMNSTADIQDMFDILHFHKNNFIAMSGVAGSVMDLSQLPDFGTGDMAENLKMWLYYKKMGALFIDRSSRKADKSFNQFGKYDDSPSRGIAVIQESIDAIEYTAHKVVGIAPQRMGDISQRAGKYTTQAAIGESSLVTEVMFNEHDMFVERVLNILLNAMRVAYRNGMTGFYVSGQHSQRMFTLSPEFMLSDLGVYITNRIADAHSIAELKGFAYEALRSNQLQIDDIFPFFRKTSLKDLEETIKFNIDKRRAEMEARTAELNNMRTQLEMAKEKGEVDLLQAQIQLTMSQVQELQDKNRVAEEALAAESRYKEMMQQNESRRVDLERQQLESDNVRGNAREVRNK